MRCCLRFMPKQTDCCPANSPTGEPIFESVGRLCHNHYLPKNERCSCGSGHCSSSPHTPLVQLTHSGSPPCPYHGRFLHAANILPEPLPGAHMQLNTPQTPQAMESLSARSILALPKLALRRESQFEMISRRVGSS